MFSRRKEEKPAARERKPRGNLPLIGYDVDMDVDDGGNDGDEDLEKELAALVGGGGRRPKQKPKKAAVAPEDLDAMVADCMKDFNDDDLSDTDDPDLMAELEEIEDEDEDSGNTNSGASDDVGVSHSFTQTIRERLSLYKEAEAVALSNGDSSRARRFNRGVKTLVELERRAAAGLAVREEDIPPVVSAGQRRPAADPGPGPTPGPAPAAVPASALAPTPAAPAPSPAAAQPPPAVQTPHPPPAAARAAQAQVSQITGQLAELQAAKEEYKRRALEAKTAGDRAAAMEMMRGIKVCDNLAAEVRQGTTVDLSILRQPQQQSQQQQQQSQAPPPAVAEHQAQAAAAPEDADTVKVPATILESLKERMAKYGEEERKAKEAGNESKARRMGRIRKQYEEAIKLHRAGRPIPRSDLPDPPGFAPIPVTDSAPAPSPAPAVVQPAAADSGPGAAATPTQATPPRQPAPAAGAQAQPAKRPSPARQTSVMSVQDKQLANLLKRQSLFKAAALAAKQQGQTDTAREYLKQALSFNKLIEVSKAGLPVEMGTLPVPPQMQVKTDMDFEIVKREDCAVVGDREEMFSKLEKDLIEQVKMCMTNRTYFKEVGDIASSNKFEQMALHAKKDLDAVRNSFKRGDPVPKFHYETRAFSRVVSNTDLTDNDLELSIINGINYVVKNPKEVDTYIRWEFPFPRDAPTVDKTAVVKDSNNPEYNSSHTLVINPRDKTFQRVVKRGAVKMEVWAKGGFLRSDTLIGTASMKLAPLETACTIHDSFDLYDGRKAVGGKVEAKVRIRNGIVAKQIEQVQEKWLVVQF